MYRPRSMMWAVIVFIISQTDDCSGSKTGTIKYDISLSEVVRPADSSVRFGEYAVNTVPTDSASNSLSYSDSLVTVVITPWRSGFAIQIHNKTNHTMAVDWSASTFVGVDGRSSTLFWTDRTNKGVVSIPRSAFITDMLAPSHFWTGSRWANILPDTTPQGSAKLFDIIRHETEVLERAEAVVGKSMRINIPIAIAGAINDYEFVLTINRAELVVPASRAQDLKNL